MGICGPEANLPSELTVDSGAHERAWDNTPLPYLLPTDSPYLRLQYSLRYICYCEGSGSNTDMHHLACRYCVYRSGALNPIHPEVDSLRDPEDATRYPMYQYPNHQLNIRDYGAGSSYCPVDIIPHFVRRSRRWRVAGMKK